MSFLFAGYTFDSDAGLSFEGRSVALPPKERELLHFLLQAGGRIVSKSDIAQQLWRGGQVSDESISRVVYRLRLAMQAAGGPPVVTTVYNGGFRISATVRQSEGKPGSGLAAWMDSALASTVVPLIISAREFAARQTPQDFAVALQAAELATRLDPHYQSAWVTVAEIRISQCMRHLGVARERGLAALTAAEHALQRNPQSAPALGARGWVRAMVQGRLHEGLLDLDNALAVDADYLPLYAWRAWVLQALGHHSAAIAMAARTQWPHAPSASTLALLPRLLLGAGRLGEALECLEPMLERFPMQDSVHEVASIALALSGQHQAALQHAVQAAALAPQVPALQVQCAAMQALTGQTGAARRMLRQLDPADSTAPLGRLAVVYAALGDLELALDRLQKAQTAGDPEVYLLRDDPRLAPLRELEGFVQLWRDDRAAAQR